MTSLDKQLADGLRGRYDIERPLGEGGMAVVFLALDLRHDRHVALKVLRPEIAADIGAERFLREIKMAVGLTHPHILPVYDSRRGRRTPVLRHAEHGGSVAPRASRPRKATVVE